jgi:uncharacterized protein YcbX
MPDARVAAIGVYPIKGCRGIDTTHADVSIAGLAIAGAGDREWMLVDSAGQFKTQRQFPRLALVQVTVTAAGLSISAPGRAPLVIPIASPLLRNDASEVQVWRSKVRGFDEGDEVAAWFSAWLGLPVRLMRFDPTAPRACNPDFVGDSGAHTMFADGYPVLVISEASLRDLNARLARHESPALPMNRFRPNVVLAGLDPHAEDHLDTIDISGVILKCVKPCVRCQVTTTDQETAEVGIEPLRTLGGYRMNEGLGGVTFGMNAIVLSGAGRTIAVGASARCEFRF